MRVRKRLLPAGWYPGSAEGVRRQIEEFRAQSPPVDRAGAPAGIVPHAGWAFSGGIAVSVYIGLDQDAETVVVVGGHLGGNDRPLASREEGFETPLGVLGSDIELLEAVEAGYPMGTDEQADNTVEVQLPMVRYFFPEARVLAVRMPPRQESFEFGRSLDAAARSLGRRLTVVGSTDLTHYGPNYDFSPRGTGRRALQWVRDENDARILRAMVALDPGAVVAAARESRAACSAGAALAAMGYGAARGATAGVLVRYGTSHDVHADDSFVGYAGLLFPAGG